MPLVRTQNNKSNIRNQIPDIWKPGAFATTDTFDYFFKNEEIIHSLDVLSSNFPPFSDSKSHWVPALALFHYTKKGEVNNWDDDHALVLTLADLFCDEVPSSARSRYSRNNLLDTARDYIKSMQRYQIKWSRITATDYEAILGRYPRWPTIADPKLDSKGDAVKVDDLIQAWDFCFRKPSPEALRRIRSGLWAIVVAFARYDMVTNDAFKQAINDVTQGLGCRVTISDNLVTLIGDHLLPLMSNTNLQWVFTNFLADKIGPDIQLSIKDKDWTTRRELRTLIKAMKKYSDFPWCVFGVLATQEQDSLLADLQTLRTKNYVRTSQKKVSSSNYPTFVYVAEELFVRLEGFARIHDGKLMTLDMIAQVEKLLDDYVNRPKQERSQWDYIQLCPQIVTALNAISIE